MQAILVLLLSVNQRENKSPGGSGENSTAGEKMVETGSDINGLYKTCRYHPSRTSSSCKCLNPEEYLTLIHPQT